MFCFCDRLNHSTFSNQTHTMTIISFQARVRGYLTRRAFHETLTCELQELLELQDPDYEEQYDLLDAFCNRVYASY